MRLAILKTPYPLKRKSSSGVRETRHTDLTNPTILSTMIVAGPSRGTGFFYFILL